jgi:acetyltransferase-like isoleucine patch superfamily enzyme
MEGRLRARVVDAYFRLLRLLRQPAYAFRRCHVSFSSRIEAGCILVDSSIGMYSYLGAGVYLHTTKLGNYCSIAAGTKIGGMEHSWWWGSTSSRISRYNRDGGQAVIEDDVWIGSNAVVRQGIHIGRGAVVGAGAVVLKDVPAYTIVAGVPAREIKKRFPDEVIEQVLATRFWECHPDKARGLLAAIDFPDVHTR